MSPILSIMGIKNYRRTTFVKVLVCFFLSFAGIKTVAAQELFVYTEPASNMATKSIGIRAANYFMRQTSTNRYNYLFAPEVMLGISKKVMAHAEGYFSNSTNRFKANGGAVYVKYRFYSVDDVHSHFRMAAYARASLLNNVIDQKAININGQNSGYETGVVATKLMNKVSLSVGSSFVHATDNYSGNKFVYGDKARNALNYNLSVGKLMLPKEYTNYEQTNLNIMLEVLGQVNAASGQNYMDIAPSAQLIILSKMRIDFGYRFALINSIQRTSTDGFLVRLEYNIFNAWK